MLFTTPRLFALLCILANFLAVFASPLSITSNSTGLQNQRRRIDTTASVDHIALEVPVEMYILHRDSEIEHWVLVMDGSRNFHAKKQGLNIQKPLKPSEYTKSYDPLIDLDGCKAKFKDRAELDKVYQELKDMQWTKTPTQKGGNCMDYVQAVLKHLLDGKHITSIPQAFTKLYDENYEKVALKVYGVKPT